ncbi:MAG: hypothetical protein LUE09_04360 [Synergistaceae bacterium]|nr:hypothetical protein [Synergistaceae bacterium]
MLPEIYNILLEHEPPVYMRILTDPSDQMYQAVESRALDVAITLHEENTRYVQIEPFYKKRDLSRRAFLMTGRRPENL